LAGGQGGAGFVDVAAAAQDQDVAEAVDGGGGELAGVGDAGQGGVQGGVRAGKVAVGDFQEDGGGVVGVADQAPVLVGGAQADAGDLVEQHDGVAHGAVGAVGDEGE
jgi:hypothetical protein